MSQISSVLGDAEAWESGVRVPVVTAHAVCVLQLLVVSVMIIVGKRQLSVFLETRDVKVSFFNWKLKTASKKSST